MQHIEAPIRIDARVGRTHADVLLGDGALVVSFVVDGDEVVALPRTLAEYRAGGTTGIPLLHPFANRLARDEFDAFGTHFDVRAAPHDRNGLPIHGTLPRPSLAVVDRTRSRVAAAAAVAGVPAFPFAHEVRVEIGVTDRRLAVTTVVRHTTVRRDEGAPMPVSFGWHPFFTLPARPRRDWVLGMPACRRHVLDPLLVPTGETVEEPADRSAIGARTYDDHFDLGAERAFELAAGERALRIELDDGYPHAQIYLPGPDWPLPGDFVCIEPMVARTNALVTGDAPTIRAGDAYTATFTVTVT